MKQFYVDHTQILHFQKKICTLIPNILLSRKVFT